MHGRTPERVPPAWAVRHRWLVLAVLATLCAWLVPGIGQLRHDDDVLAFLPPEHPDVVAFEQVAERFGMLSVGLVGLRAEDAGSLLTPARTEAVRALGQRLARRDGVRLVLSYPDLPDARVEADTLVVDVLVPEGTPAPEIAERVLGNANAVGNLVAADGTAAAFLVYLLPEADATARARVLADLRQVVEADWPGQAFFGGAPFVEDTAARASRADIERLSPVVIAVLAGASAVLLRSLWGAALNLLVTGLGVALMVGAHGRFGEPFTIVSSTIPVMMVALGGAFGMHVISGFQRQSGSSPERASAAVAELGWPVVLSAVTTAVAFFALLVMPQVPMRRFGVVAGFGVLGLLGLALWVLPALLSLLPRGAMRTRTSEGGGSPLRLVPPLAVLAVLAAGGGALGAWRLRADPDTSAVFDPQSEPARADRFFEEHFGGSQFVQLAIETDLHEPTALRRIRTMEEAIAALPGVSDVRSLLGPVALLTEGFGGREGIPSTPDRARRVLVNLADQAPMAQLMTPDRRGAIVHVKLAPGADLEAVTAAIRARVIDGPLRVGAMAGDELGEAARAHVRARIAAIVGSPLPGADLEAMLQPGEAADPELRDRVEALRQRALGTDELIEPLRPEQYAELTAAVILQTARDALAEVVAARVPDLAQADPEGVDIVADQLGRWVAEARAQRRVERMCERLGLPVFDPSSPPGADGGAGLAPRCKRLLAAAEELTDPEWEIPPGSATDPRRVVPFEVRVTGQPILGQAFAESVTRSLWVSTAVSIAALGLVLALAGHLRAMVPAVWTLAVTLGALAGLGHPISVGTSMVTCISLGAGVDFAIHLAVRARRCSAPRPGAVAVDALGAVVLVTGLQLALAFLVLLASSMPPLRQFGLGLAIGLVTAAAGAVWFTPRLFPSAARPSGGK